jgi:hypothetical protein
MKNEKGILGAGLFSAITASLCYVTPVLALVAGTSGMAATFSWIEPFRPYLILPHMQFLFVSKDLCSPAFFSPRIAPHNLAAC